MGKLKKFRSNTVLFLEDGNRIELQHSVVYSELPAWRSPDETSDIVEFDPMRLDEKYENVEKSRNGANMGSRVTYYVKGKCGDVGCISFGQIHEMYVELDNFPAQRKHFVSHLPIRSWQELERDILRCGMTLISSNPKG